MAAEAPTKLVERLAAVAELGLAAFEEVLETKGQAGKESPSWQIFEFDLEQGVFERADLRLALDGDRALLILHSGDPSKLSEGDLELGPWGELSSIRVNPDIPPEGTMTYIYHLEDVKVSVQLTHSSRGLRSMALEWGAE